MSLEFAPYYVNHVEAVEDRFPIATVTFREDLDFGFKMGVAVETDRGWRHAISWRTRRALPDPEKIAWMIWHAFEARHQRALRRVSDGQ